MARRERRAVARLSINRTRIRVGDRAGLAQVWPLPGRTSCTLVGGSFHAIELSLGPCVRPVARKSRRTARTHRRPGWRGPCSRLPPGAGGRDMATGNPGRRERGFSLIELMVAMVATLIISGAVMQLVGAGKGAFRREPERSDRQQNIRMAMSMIQQDVQRAGLGLPPFIQTFTNGLNNLGPQVPDGGLGTKTDELEVISSTPCPGGEGGLVSSGGVNIDHRARTLRRLLRRSRRIVGALGRQRALRAGLRATASATAGTRSQGDSRELPGRRRTRINPNGGKCGLRSRRDMGLVSVDALPDPDWTPTACRTSGAARTEGTTSTASPPGSWSPAASRTCRCSTATATGLQDTPGNRHLRRTPASPDSRGVRQGHPPGPRSRSPLAPLANNLQGATTSSSGPTAIRGTLTQDIDAALRPDHADLGDRRQQQVALSRPRVRAALSP